MKYFKVIARTIEKKINSTFLKLYRNKFSAFKDVL